MTDGELREANERPGRHVRVRLQEGLQGQAFWKGVGRKLTERVRKETDITWDIIVPTHENKLSYQLFPKWHRMAIGTSRTEENGEGAVVDDLLRHAKEAWNAAAPNAT